MSNRGMDGWHEMYGMMFQSALGIEGVQGLSAISIGGRERSQYIRSHLKLVSVSPDIRPLSCYSLSRLPQLASTTPEKEKIHVRHFHDTSTSPQAIPSLLTPHTSAIKVDLGRGGSVDSQDINPH